MKTKTFIIIIAIAAVTLPAQGETFEALLEKYLSEAVKYNPGLKARMQAVEAEKMGVIQARSNMLPSLEFSSRYTRAGGGREFIFDLNPFGFPMVIRENFMREREQETKFSLVQPLFTGGSYFYNYRARRHLRESSQFGLEVYERKLKLKTAEAFIQYLTAGEMVKSTAKAIERAEENLRTAKIKVLAGAGTPADTLRAGAELVITKADHSAAINRVDLAARELMRLTGCSREDIKIPDKAPSPESYSLTEEEILSAEKSSGSNRYEIRQFEAAVKSGNNAVKASRGSFLPSVLIAADYGWQGERYRLNSDYDMWMVSGIFKWNLFNGMGDKARLDANRMKTREMQFKQYELQEAVALSVRAAAIKLEDACNEWKAARESLKAAEENYRIRRVLFQTGRGSLLELLDAAEFFNQASAGEIVGRYQILSAQINYQWASGGDLLKLKVK